jgi:hypothetical protein
MLVCGTLYRVFNACSVLHVGHAQCGLYSSRTSAQASVRCQRLLLTRTSCAAISCARQPKPRNAVYNVLQHSTTAQHNMLQHSTTAQYNVLQHRTRCCTTVPRAATCCTTVPQMQPLRAPGRRTCRPFGAAHCCSPLVPLRRSGLRAAQQARRRLVAGLRVLLMSTGARKRRGIRAHC